MPQKTYMYDTQWNQLINAINTGDSSAIVTAISNIKTSIDNIYTRLNAVGVNSTQWDNLVDAINTGDSSAIVTAISNIKTSIDNIYTRLNAVGVNSTQWDNLVDAINTGDSSAIVTAISNIKTSLDNINTQLDTVGFNSVQWNQLIYAINAGDTPAISTARTNITSKLSNLSQAVSEQNLAKYGYKIGDYFTGASGYTYILADYNTFKGISTPYCLTQNHLGIVVDTHKTSQWHSENASSVGYNGSVLHTFLKGTVMDNIKSDFKTLFGGSTGLEHLLPHSKLLTNAFASWDWQANQYISALTCTQIDAGSQWTANGFQEGEASKSLELFRKYKWTEIFGNEYLWLRNLSNYSTGGSSACYAYSYGVMSGNYSVTDSYFAVGLINFY